MRWSSEGTGALKALELLEEMQQKLLTFVRPDNYLIKPKTGDIHVQDLPAR